jgi:hypothetical protein
MGNPARMNAAERFNRECDCTLVDLPELRRRLNIESTHPHLFSPAPVFVSVAQVREMQRTVQAIETLSGLQGYQHEVLARAPRIARDTQTAAGVFMGFDFHLTPQGPKLIEINTNAGGAFLNVAARELQRACCDGTDGLVSRQPPASVLEEELFDMFAREWRASRGARRLRSIAIVDSNPEQQYLYPEFLLAKRLFERHGVRAYIVDPGDLALERNELQLRGEPIDLVYNRLTDFYFEEPRHQVLRSAYERQLAVITPHPHAHAVHANKHNLVVLSDAAALGRLGATPEVIEQLARIVPDTKSVGEGGEHWWAGRRSWFFKPGSGFGSRGSYRGDKLTRRVFTEVMAGDYVAQELTPPSERWRTKPEGRQAYKVDLRCYAYAGRVQLMAARLYQGQTTNFRTEGGGFAPVYTVDGAWLDQPLVAQNAAGVLAGETPARPRSSSYPD